MSLWELRACVEGYRRANGGPEKTPPPSDDEHLERVARLRANRKPS